MVTLWILAWRCRVRHFYLEEWPIRQDEAADWQAKQDIRNNEKIKSISILVPAQERIDRIILSMRHATFSTKMTFPTTTPGIGGGQARSTSYASLLICAECPTPQPPLALSAIYGPRSSLDLVAV